MKRSVRTRVEFGSIGNLFGLRFVMVELRLMCSKFLLRAS